MAKTSRTEQCPTCEEVELTVWVESTASGARPGVRAWVDQADAPHLVECQIAAAERIAILEGGDLVPE